MGQHNGSFRPTSAQDPLLALARAIDQGYPGRRVPEYEIGMRASQCQTLSLPVQG